MSRTPDNGEPQSQTPNLDRYWPEILEMAIDLGPIWEKERASELMQGLRETSPEAGELLEEMKRSLPEANPEEQELAGFKSRLDVSLSLEAPPITPTTFSHVARNVGELDHPRRMFLHMFTLEIGAQWLIANQDKIPEITKDAKFEAYAAARRKVFPSYWNEEMHGILVIEYFTEELAEKLFGWRYNRETQTFDL